MILCYYVQPNLLPFTMGELRPMQARIVRSHTQACARCKSALNALNESIKLVMGTGKIDYIPPDDFGKRVMEALHGMPAPNQMRKKTWWRWLSLCLAFLGTGYLLGRSQGGWSHSSKSGIPSVEQAAELCMKPGVVLSSIVHPVKTLPAFLGVSTALPLLPWDQTPAFYRVVQNRKIACLCGSCDGKRFTLYIMPNKYLSGAAMDHSLQLMPAADSTLAYWHGRHVSFLAVASAGYVPMTALLEKGNIAQTY